MGTEQSTKRCSRCQTDQPTTCFRRDTKRRDGLNPWCRDCSLKYQRERHQKDPTRRRRQTLEQRYGITLEEYEHRVEAQGGVCAVCRKPNTQIDPRNGRARALHVDHDHETGAVRDLLCHLCNSALGSVSDDPTLLRALADYLERHGR